VFITLIIDMFYRLDAKSQLGGIALEPTSSLAPQPIISGPGWIRTSDQEKFG
jgi:hypothetical protein